MKWKIVPNCDKPYVGQCVFGQGHKGKCLDIEELEAEMRNPDAWEEVKD